MRCLFRCNVRLNHAARRSASICLLMLAVGGCPTTPSDTTANTNGAANSNGQTNANGDSNTNANASANTNDNSAAAIVDVEMINTAFSPETITIRVGQTVRWTNLDFLVHTVTSGSPGAMDAGSVFESGNLARNQLFSRTFTEPGDFIYFCEFHPFDMRDAHVVVEP